MIDNDCLFCKISSKKFDTHFVYEDDKVLAFNDISPQAPVHILVIPKEHFNSIKEISDKELTGHLLMVCNLIAKEKKLENFRIVLNTGEEAGQSVFHLHVHLLGGRKMNWPPG